MWNKSGRTMEVRWKWSWCRKLSLIGHCAVYRIWEIGIRTAIYGVRLVNCNWFQCSLLCHLAASGVRNLVNWMEKSRGHTNEREIDKKTSNLVRPAMAKAVFHFQFFSTRIYRVDVINACRKFTIGLCAIFERQLPKNTHTHTVDTINRKHSISIRSRKNHAQTQL